MEAISKLFSKACRHEPFHKDAEGRRFAHAITSRDRVDGWANVHELIERLPGHESQNHKLAREEILGPPRIGP